MSFATLAAVLDGIAWTINSDAEWIAAEAAQNADGRGQVSHYATEHATDWALVTECEVIVYTSGPCAGQSSVNWTVGGACDWCGRSVHVCPGHRADGTLVTYERPALA